MAFPKADPALQDYLISPLYLARMSQRNGNCPWCYHVWHLALCGMIVCHCDDADVPLDDTWRPSGIYPHAPAKIMSDTGADGWAASIASKRRPISDYLYILPTS